MENAQAGAVQALWRYPIKSMMGEALDASMVTARGLNGDRAYALVDKSSNRSAVVRSWGARLLSYRAEYLDEPPTDGPAAAVRIRTPEGVELITTAPDIDARLSEPFERTLSLMTLAPEGLLVEFPAGTLGGKAAAVTEGVGSAQAPAGTFFDVAPVHLIAASTLERLSGHASGAVDARRFRPNIVVADAGEAFVENSWVGHTLAVGDEVRLRVTMACMRCVNVTLPQDDLPREAGLLKTIAQGNLVDFGDIGKLPCVGVYATVASPGRVRTGDRVRLLH